MAVRKRTWTVKSTGEEKTAWIVDYFDRNRKRHIETFKRMKDADARAIEVGNDIKIGVHVARNASITVATAGANWIARANATSANAAPSSSTADTCATTSSRTLAP